MILTGKEIMNQYIAGNIVIKPFLEENINPNSYNYRLGNSIKVFSKMNGDTPIFIEKKIPKNGFCLEPNILYLANTLEVIGSKKYAMSLIGRSSIGRLGLFLQISANLGHTTSKHQWTLELIACKKIRIYPNMVIGQVSFWDNKGDFSEYRGVYGNIDRIQESLVYDINSK